MSTATQFFRFAIVGTLGFVADVSVLFALMQLGAGPFMGRLVSFLCAVWVTWFLNRRFTFGSGRPSGAAEPLKYLLAMTIGGIANYLSYSLVVVLFPGQPLAPLAGVAVGSVAGMGLNFLSAKLWVFRATADSKQRRADEQAISWDHPALISTIVPILFGLFAVLRGADANWDLYNYHLYGPFALINGKHAIDLAPAGFQGYFNPFLDVVPYLLNTSLPPILSGFLQGAFHGLVFIFVLQISRAALRLPGSAETRIPLFVALAGCLTANFLSELGTTMGDNTTAVFVLAGISLLTWQWERLRNLEGGGIATLLAAGLLVGLATGLKLTNATSAIAICLSLLLVYPAWPAKKLGIAFLFGIGVTGGFLVTGGPWMLRMWMEHGNPLFPQFGSIFPNPLAEPMSVADQRWLPKSITEYLLWPFIISLDARRAGELGLRQAIWAIVYALMIIWAFRALASRREETEPRTLNRLQLFVICYVAFAFVVWTLLFSIYRYAVPFELLAPLVVVLLAQRIWRIETARRVSTWALSLAVLLVATSLHRTWGHEGWAAPLYHTSLEDFDRPAQTTVLLNSQPLGWLATLHSPEVAFIGLNTSFPDGPTFQTRIDEIVRSRDGPIYVFTSGASDERAEKIAGYDRLASSWGVSETSWGCNLLRAVSGKLRFRLEEAENKSTCRLSAREEDKLDVSAMNAALARQTAADIESYGFKLDESSCRPFWAGIGAGSKAYQICTARYGR